MGCFGRGILQLIVVLLLIQLAPIYIIHAAGLAYTLKSGLGTGIFRRESHFWENGGRPAFWWMIWELRLSVLCFFCNFLQARTPSLVLAQPRGRHLPGHSRGSKSKRAQVGISKALKQGHLQSSLTLSVLFHMFSNTFGNPVVWRAKSLLLIQENDHLQILMLRFTRFYQELAAGSDLAPCSLSECRE